MDSYSQVSNNIGRDELSRSFKHIPPRLMSRRLYHLTIGGITAASFAFIAVVYQYFMATPGALMGLPGWMIVGSFILPLVGVIVLSLSSNSRNLFGGVVGYLATVLPIGLLTAYCITVYNIAEITAAIGVTAIIAISFATLGFVKPSFFARIMPVCGFCLLIIVIAEFILFLLGIQQTITDYIVVVIFCGIIGYDFYHAANDVPTLDNAIWYACEIFLDLLNVFLRVLNIRHRD